MDLTNTTSQRFKLGIERFLGGHQIQYKGCTFKVVDGVIKICCFSNYHISKPSVTEAKNKIMRSKELLEDLFSKIPEHQNLLGLMPVVYCFCQDYGKGGVIIAKESRGSFQWYGG